MNYIIEKSDTNKKITLLQKNDFKLSTLSDANNIDDFNFNKAK